MFRKWLPLIALLVFVSYHAQAASITEALSVGSVSGSVFIEQSFLLTVLGTVDLGGHVRFGQLDFIANIEGGEANPPGPCKPIDPTMPYGCQGFVLDSVFFAGARLDNSYT